jgi:serine/threonine-protein kinase RsbW
VRVSEFLAGKAATAGSHADPDAIELRLGARLEHLPIIRSLAATLAIRADFDLDAIADLKLAVDEACSTLITRAIEGSILACSFVVHSNEIRFSAAASSRTDNEPSTDSFGWRVLTTLTDEANSWVDKSELAGYLVRIEITKRKLSSG